MQLNEGREAKRHSINWDHVVSPSHIQSKLTKNVIINHQ